MKKKDVTKRSKEIAAKLKNSKMSDAGKSAIKTLGCFVGTTAFCGIGSGLVKAGVENIVNTETTSGEKIVGALGVGVGFTNYLIGYGCATAGIGYAIDTANLIGENINNILDNDDEDFDDIEVDLDE